MLQRLVGNDTEIELLDGNNVKISGCFGQRAGLRVQLQNHRLSGGRDSPLLMQAGRGEG